MEIVRSTKASCVIPKFDKIFSTHRIPISMATDNAPPPFNIAEYSRYLKALGINEDHSTPKWPQGNAEVERLNQSLNRSLTTATLEGKVWQQELNRFLLQYRTTPHATTKVPPAELLFNRVINGKLPSLQRKCIINRHKEAKANEQLRKTYNKSYADRRRGVKRRRNYLHILVKFH